MKHAAHDGQRHARSKSNLPTAWPNGTRRAPTPRPCHRARHGAPPIQTRTPPPAKSRDSSTSPHMPLCNPPEGSPPHHSSLRQPNAPIAGAGNGKRKPGALAPSAGFGARPLPPSPHPFPTLFNANENTRRKKCPGGRHGGAQSAETRCITPSGKNAGNTSEKTGKS